ncbi:RecT family protein [Tetraselmis viridis virus SI1]|uniref:RecT-like ssDNA annealing protein n=1 Tax=Tetraselmis viridis virus S20 TaxID=754070 RepID=UPI0002C0D4A9|nr:RecT-like ssDNA annealing protein [Tetraselmis viridis virus S20]AGH31344.1 RecT family protein [Tetraselmis viridis virus S20]AGH31432.1 RecT family protein [Tetraselmis viridis virus SI1]
MTDESQNLPAERKPREFMPVESGVALYDTSRFEHMQRVASVMAKSTLIPDALKAQTYDQTMGNCFLVVNQALHWQMDPFAVAQCMSVVHGKPCYEGKLIAAVLQGRLGVRLRYEWNDETGDKFAITVTGKHPEDDEPVSVTGTVGDWKTSEKNGNTKANWTGANARRQLAYRGAREWCRLYAPELLLGVYAIDEMEDAYAGKVDTRGGPVIDLPKISAGFSSEEAQEGPDTVQGPEPEDEPETAAGKDQGQNEPASEPEATGDIPEPEPGDTLEPESRTPEPASEEEAEPEPDPEPAADEAPDDEGDEPSQAEEEATEVMSSLIMGFEKCEDWESIKRCLAHVAKETPDAWANAPAWLASKVRGAAFARGQDVQQDLDYSTDITAYRCWLELVEDPDAIRDAWGEMMELPMFTKLADSKQEGLKTLTMDRIAFLEEGHDE